MLQCEGRLSAWHQHFSNLIAAAAPEEALNITKVLDTYQEISTDPFSMEELDAALGQMKCDKVLGMDGLGVTNWQLPDVKPKLLHFCNRTFNGSLPSQCGEAGIVPIHKKGNLAFPTNYRGISSTQIAAKIYNKMLLNRIRPTIDPLLRFNQNGFRRSRSTAGQILELRRLVEEVRNSKLDRELVLLFVDFTKAFHSIGTLCSKYYMHMIYHPR